MRNGGEGCKGVLRSWFSRVRNIEPDYLPRCAAGRGRKLEGHPDFAWTKPLYTQLAEEWRTSRSDRARGVRKPSILLPEPTVSFQPYLEEGRYCRVKGGQMWALSSVQFKVRRRLPILERESERRKTAVLSHKYQCSG